MFDRLNAFRLKNPKKITLGHLNINSIPNKFEGIMTLVSNKLDVFLISETKIDDTFPDAQFLHKGYCVPHRKDRKIGAGGLLLYTNENIPSRKLTEHILPDDIEILCIELNLKKEKWVIMGIYRPPDMNQNYFFNHLSRIIDFYSTKYERIIIMGDFNVEPINPNMINLCDSYDLFNLVKEPTCFKGPPKCYDLILTNCKHNFQHTQTLTTGFSDFHKMTVTVLKTEFTKPDPIQINYRDYKKFNSVNFKRDLHHKLQYDLTASSDYDRFHDILREVLDSYAPIKKKILRANNSPFMTKTLRKMIMNRSRCKNRFFKNRTVENWENYRKLRNECVKLTKKVKREYFENLDIKKVNDNKKFWKVVKPLFTNSNKTNMKITLVENDQIILDDKKTVEIFNDYFVNITKGLDIGLNDLEVDLYNITVDIADPVEKIIHQYHNHPSILNIRKNVCSSKSFSFSKINQINMEK